MEKGLSKLNKFELILYRVFGIVIFRKFILRVEKIKHRKDGLQNRNYHLRQMSVDSMEHHTGFLLYNSFIHSFSLFLTGICFIVVSISGIKNIWLNLFMFVISMLNIYCIMLQRFVYLKLKALRGRYEKKNELFIEKKGEVVLEKLKTIYDEDMIVQDKALLTKIKECRYTGRTCYLTENDNQVLERWGELLNGVCMQRNLRRSQDKKEGRPASIAELSKICGENAKFCTQVEKYAAALYGRFCKSRNKELTLVTVSKETEELYRKIFLVDSTNEAVRIIGILDKVYKNILENEGT